MDIRKTPPRWAGGVLCAYAWIAGGLPVALAQDATDGGAGEQALVEEIVVTGTRTLSHPLVFSHK